jgi:hypothetical protein
MNLVDELRKLQELHQSGALTDDEFAAAKAAVLAKGAEGGEIGNDQGVQSRLEEIKLQNEIARLDREWQLERERYMVTGRFGQRSVPSQFTSVLGGLVIVGFGIVWTSMAASMGAPGFFPMFGVIFICTGLGMSIYSFTKAGEYDRAFESYKRRRSRLIAGPDEPRFPEADS